MGTSGKLLEGKSLQCHWITEAKKLAAAVKSGLAAVKSGPTAVKSGLAAVHLIQRELRSKQEGTTQHKYD